MPLQITTPRLILREFRSDDLENCLKMGNDPEVMRYTGEPMPDRSKMEHIIENVVKADYRKHGFGRWIMELRSTGEFMGFCGLKYVEEEEDVDIGFRMFKRFWGNGYATEAAIPCMEYGFLKLGLEKITGYVIAENTASLRVLEKLHMDFEKTIQEDELEYLAFGVTREKWMQSKSHIKATYSANAGAYFETFAAELRHKPKDIEWLDRFAKSIPAGMVWEIGCGSGHIAAWLAAHNVNAIGTDFSDEMLQQARSHWPAVEYFRQDFFNLTAEDTSLAGIVGFYAVVNYPTKELKPAFAEMYRVLAPGGRLLLSFHCGEGSLLNEDFLDSGIELTFHFHDPKAFCEALESVGFQIEDCLVRSAYPEVEYPTERAYVFAQKIE